MRWMLLSFLSTGGAVIVAACILVLFTRGRVRRHLRVDPAVSTAAPLSWLVDPRAPAQVHRRLASIGRAAGRVADDHRREKRFARRAPERPPIVAMADALRADAVRLDEQLTDVARLAPPDRTALLAHLARAATELEHAAAELGALSARLPSPPATPRRAARARPSHGLR